MCKDPSQGSQHSFQESHALGCKHGSQDQVCPETVGGPLSKVNACGQESPCISPARDFRSPPVVSWRSPSIAHGVGLSPLAAHPGTAGFRQSQPTRQWTSKTEVTISCSPITEVIIPSLLPHCVGQKKGKAFLLLTHGDWVTQRCDYYSMEITGDSPRGCPWPENPPAVILHRNLSGAPILRFSQLRPWGRLSQRLAALECKWWHRKGKPA